MKLNHILNEATETIEHHEQFDDIVDKLEYVNEKHNFLEEQYSSLLTLMRREMQDYFDTTGNNPHLEFETTHYTSYNAKLPSTLSYFKRFSKKDELISVWKELEDIKERGSELINSLIDLKHTLREKIKKMIKMSTIMFKRNLSRQGVDVHNKKELAKNMFYSEDFVYTPHGKFWKGALKDKRFDEQYTELEKLYKKVDQLIKDIHADE